MYKRLTDYFRKSEKVKSDFKIGVEFEHFIVKKKTFEAVNYSQKNGIKEILSLLVDNYDWNPLYNGSNIVGLEKRDINISLEPAGQIEISIAPKKTVLEIESIYTSALYEIMSELSKFDYDLLALAYQPKTSINQIPLIPKKRYYKMYDYFKKTGSMAHNMMKGTASIQIAIDYFSERDFCRKIRLAYRLTPLIALLFDNSLFFETQPYKKNLLRQTIWNNCDDERCGFIPGVFSSNFGYKKYSEYMLDMSPIFILDKSDNIVDWQQPLKDIYDEKWTYKQFRHIFSMHFPTVRARNYIEIRSADALPYPVNLCLLYLVQLIFYNPEVTDFLDLLLANIKEKEITESINDITNNGFNASYNNKPLTYYFDKIKDIITINLNCTNRNYLEFICLLIEKKKSYKDLLLDHFDDYDSLLRTISISHLIRCQSCAHL